MKAAVRNQVRDWAIESLKVFKVIDKNGDVVIAG